MVRDNGKMSNILGRIVQEYTPEEIVKLKCSCGGTTTFSLVEISSNIDTAKMPRSSNCNCFSINIDRGMNREQRRHPQKRTIPPNMAWTTIKRKHS